MWIVYYADATVRSSEETHWSAISERQTSYETTFDVLKKPAFEIRVRLSLHDAWHRLRSPQPVQFFHYHRVRTNLFDTAHVEILYEAVGYCFAGGRIVLEVAPGMGVTRVELGDQFSFDAITV